MIRSTVSIFVQEYHLFFFFFPTGASSVLLLFLLLPPSLRSSFFHSLVHLFASLSLSLRAGLEYCFRTWKH